MPVNTLAAFTILLCGAASSPIPTQGLLAWFDAGDQATLTLEGGRVVAWASKGAPSCTATAPETQRPGYAPRGEGPLRPAVLFDGPDTVLRAPAFNQKADTWTLAAVVAPYGPCRGGGICSAAPRGGDDFDPGFTVDLYQSDKVFDQVSVEGAGRVGGQRDQMPSALPCGGFHVVVVVRSPGQIDLYVDGLHEGTRAVAPATTVMDELRLGARCYAGREQAYFNGEMAQVLLYGRALDDPDRRTVEAALRVTPEECQAGEQAFVQLLEQRRRARMVAPSVLQSWPSVAAFAAEKTGVQPPEAMPIRADLREAIELGVRHLNSLYDRDKDNEPFFFVNREADGTGKMRHSVNIGIPHVVGRCLLGCMAAELDAGVPFPQDGLAILERYCRQSFDNPDHLNSYHDPEKGGARFIEFHNMREGLYGLWALIAGRQSAWARAAAHQMLETLDGITDADGLWSVELARQRGMAERCQGLAAANAARMVDALLAYHDATGDALAMKLAGAYARKGLETLYLEDGRFAPMERSSGHVHSITSSLSGITAYALRTGDQAMVNRCRSIMENGVPEYFSSWGWGDEVFPEHPADVASRGEINQTGDVVRTALLLGGAGWPEYFDTAERFLRGMILPTQHRAPELGRILNDKPNPADDSERDTVARSVGGYAMQLPNDRMRAGDWPISTLDITSGAVHAMSAAWRQRTVVKDGVYRMQLLFDFEDEALALKSGLPVQGRIAFHAKQAVQGLKVRIPGWVDPAAVKVILDGKPAPVNMDGAYVSLGALAAGTDGEVTFDVPCKREKETVDGTAYTTTWIGGQVVDIQPRGKESPLPF